jgi:acylphosphatase
VVQGIEASPEYLDDLVSSLYQQYLQRAADPGGLNGWVGLLQHGGTIEQVISGLVSSPEYYALQGGTNSAFVASLYPSILHRTGSPAEVQAWVNAMARGVTATQVINNFLSSQEYRTNLVEAYYLNDLGVPADAATLTAYVSRLKQGTPDQVVQASIISLGDFTQPAASPVGVDPNALYVDYLYQSLLGRAADPTELNAWVSGLDHGISPSAVVQGIEASPEYLGDLVSSLYQQYLQATADPTGLNGWVGLLQHGGTIEQVISGLVSSPEYHALQGGTNSAFVASLYTNILDRTGSSAEVQGWVNAMAHGMTPTQVANAILNSGEYRTNLVEADYQTYLSRAADAAALAGWLNRLNQGVPDQAVLASILGSPEAFGLYS